MTQNIYDNPDFFAAYARLPRSQDGLEGMPEWPALRALLPSLEDRRVLDLGCGYGWFCRWAREQGAAEIVGLDVSQRMLERAGEMTAPDRIVFRQADLETVELETRRWDLVYSALAFHYIARLDRLFAAVGAALGPGGDFVFSVEHPLYTAPSDPTWLAASDRKVWPLDRYLDEGPRSTDWLAKGVIKHHRTIGTYLGLLLGAGLSIVHVEEWGPTPAQIAAHPEWTVERDRPPFLLIAARR